MSAASSSRNSGSGIGDIGDALSLYLTDVSRTPLRWLQVDN